MSLDGCVPERLLCQYQGTEICRRVSRGATLSWAEQWNGLTRAEAAEQDHPGRILYTSGETWIIGRQEDRDQLDGMWVDTWINVVETRQRTTHLDRLVPLLFRILKVFLLAAGRGPTPNSGEHGHPSHHMVPNTDSFPQPTRRYHKYLQRAASGRVLASRR